MLIFSKSIKLLNITLKVFKRSFEPRGMFRKQSELIWTNIKHFEENLKKSFFSNFQGFLRAHRRLGPGFSSHDVRNLLKIGFEHSNTPYSNQKRG